MGAAKRVWADSNISIRKNEKVEKHLFKEVSPFFCAKAEENPGKELKCIFIHEFPLICKSIEKFGKIRGIHKFFASTKR